MARIAINVQRHPDPSLVEEDVEIAAAQADLKDFHVIAWDNSSFTVDLYSDRDASILAIAKLHEALPDDGEYTLEGINEFPPRGWAFAELPIRY